MSAAEAHLVSRCREALRQCRGNLQDLRAVCNAATSHKASCAQLLEAGTAAVDALEQLVTAAGSDLERCRAAQQMAARVQGALDQAEALAKTYGRKQLLNRFASEVLSLMTNQVPLKFDGAITELTNLAKKMRHDVLHPPTSESGRAAGGMLRGSIPATLTSGSTGMDSRGPSTAYGSLGSTFMGSTVYGSPNSCTLGDSRSTSGVVAIRSSGGAGVAAGVLYGTGRAAAPGFGTQQQQQQRQQQLGQAGAGSGGQEQLEVDAAAAAQPAEEAASLFGGWGIAWDELQRVQLLSKSESGQGQVWLGRWQETDVIIRQLPSLEGQSSSQEQLQHDDSGAAQPNKAVLEALDGAIGPMREMRHPNVVLFMGMVLDPPAIVTEYCARGSLRDLLQHARGTAGLAAALSWQRRLRMALEAAKGVMYLHGAKPPVVHPDLKATNLMVEKSWGVKVANLSLPRDAAAAPASKADDVFAFGLVLLELLTWQPADAQQGQLPPVPSEAEAAQLPGGTFAALSDYTALIQRCWAERPEERPSMEQIVSELRQIVEKTTAAQTDADNDDQQ